MTDFSSDSIVLLQQLERTTKTALAQTAQVSVATMSKVVNKQSPMGGQLAERLAMGMDYPVKFFSSEVSRIPVLDLTYRHTSKSSVSELNAVAAEYSFLRHTANILSHRVNLTSRASWIDRIAPREEIGHAEIVRLAYQARENLELVDTGCVGNVTLSLERNGILVAPLKTLLPIMGEEHLHSDGVTCPVTSGGLPVIGFSPATGAGDRERFTKAHELGHLILHRYRKPAKYRDMEREAHAFAGAFLMPEKDATMLLSPTTTLSELVYLKSTWGMSISSLISRGYQSGVFSKERWRSLYMQLSARGWRKSEPVVVEQERPSLFRALMKKQYGDPQGRIDSFLVENDLGVPFRYLDIWSGGLVEQGSELGFKARRFSI